MRQLATLSDYCAANGVIAQQDVTLADYCTFKIGGKTPLMIRPNSGQAAGVLREARRLEIPLLVLGKGSNLLFADAGYPGAVLLMGPEFARMELVDDVTISCESGAPLSRLCVFACENGLSGLEFAYGIPGSVGGAVYMNAGAYGGEITDVVVRAEHLTPEGKAGSLSGEELGFSYRHSAYQENGMLITRALFRLKKGDPEAIRRQMEDFMGRRRDKQPLEFPSAGSTFKRPRGDFASALIDRCGLKGLRVGGAEVSEKHAGFIINRDRATAADVAALIERVREEVLRQTGFHLECEVKMIGF